MSLITAIGGFLLGYDSGVISGAILHMKVELFLTPTQQGVVISMVPLGAILGAFSGGFLSDRWGRKKIILTASIIFIISVLCLSFSDATTQVIISRFIMGIALGMYLAITPLYIAELAPPNRRGSLVSFIQLAITIGVLAAYLIGIFFIDIASWRIMFYIAAVPATLQFISMLFFPESPSWLINHNQTKEAVTILTLFRDSNEQAELEVSTMQRNKEKQGLFKTSQFKKIFEKSFRPILIIGLGITIIQQVTGINAIFYYAPTIFYFAGFTSHKSVILITTCLGLINVLMTIVSIFLLDKMGRKPLLIIGLAGMIVSLITLGIGFHFQESLLMARKISVISLLVYVSFFAFSLGPIAGLLNTEIYPLSVRGLAVGLATCVNWFSNFVITLTFLDLTNLLGKSGIFWLYALIGIIGLLFIIRKIPETKNKSLEEIEGYWIKGDKIPSNPLS